MSKNWAGKRITEEALIRCYGAGREEDPRLRWWVTIAGRRYALTDWDRDTCTYLLESADDQEARHYGDSLAD
jgi:hypothetical protein